MEAASVDSPIQVHRGGLSLQWMLPLDWKLWEVCGREHADPNLDRDKCRKAYSREHVTCIDSAVKMLESAEEMVGKVETNWKSFLFLRSNMRPSTFCKGQGCWLFFIPKHLAFVNQYWKTLLSGLMVQETFLAYRNAICSVDISCTDEKFKIRIWISDRQRDEIKLAIGQIAKALLKRYLQHETPELFYLTYFQQRKVQHPEDVFRDYLPY